MSVRSNLGFLMAAFGAMGFMFGGAQAADEQARPEDRPRSARQAPSREGADQLISAGLEIGAPLPDLTVYDASGNPFSLGQLKGRYSVLVFGCLT